MPRLMGLISSGKPAEEILSGRQWVRVANTPISLNTAPAGGAAIPLGCREVLVQADPVNAGNVVVGDVMVTILPARGIILTPGDSLTIAIDDVSKTFVSGANVNDAVCWVIVR